MAQNDDLTLVMIVDMYIYYNSADHALGYVLTDTRASVVEEGLASKKWQSHTAVPSEAWALKGMGIFSLASIHFWNHDLDFAYYDVGANVGMTTIAQAIFFQRCGHSNHTFAFEPGPIYNTLEKSVAINGLTDSVTLSCAAASDVAGEAIFHVTPKQSPASSLLQAAVERPGVIMTVPVTVQTVRLDDMIDKQTAPHALVKIDAEGADFKVIAGMARAMRDRLCVILIEFFPTLVETYTDPVARLLEIGRDFDLLEVKGARLSPIESKPDSIRDMIVRTKQRAMPATDLMLLPKRLPGLEVLRQRLIDN